MSSYKKEFPSLLADTDRCQDVSSVALDWRGFAAVRGRLAPSLLLLLGLSLADSHQLDLLLSPADDDWGWKRAPLAGGPGMVGRARLPVWADRRLTLCVGVPVGGELPLHQHSHEAEGWPDAHDHPAVPAEWRGGRQAQAVVHVWCQGKHLHEIVRTHCHHSRAEHGGRDHR